MSRFNNKNIIVTGGSSGIGYATAKTLVQEGAKVLITGTNADKLAVAATELGVATLVNDAGDPTSADALAAAARELGPIDGAFLNAGFGRFAPIEDATAAEFDAQFNVNVRGPLLQARALSPLLREGASVLLNTSVARDIGMGGAAIYAWSSGWLR